MPLPCEYTATSRDFWALPEGRRAELIDGVLYDMAPPSTRHQLLVAGITSAFTVFIAREGGSCRAIPAPFAVNLDADDSTWVEPDVSVVCDPAKLSDRGCEGAPDLVVEVVSPSSRTMDYIQKLARYQRAGVREYWIVDPTSEQTVVYDFADGRQLLKHFSFTDPVPAGLYDGRLVVNMSKLV